MNRPRQLEGEENRLRWRQFIQDFFLVVPEGGMTVEDRRFGSRCVGNHINPHVQPIAEEAASKISDNMNGILGLQTLRVPDNCQRKLKAEFSRYYRHKLAFKSNHSNVNPSLANNIVSPETRDAISSFLELVDEFKAGETQIGPVLENDMQSFLVLLMVPYMDSCRPLFVELYRQKDSIPAQMIQGAALYNSATAAFAENMQEYMFGLHEGLYTAITFLVGRELSLDNMAFEKLSLIFYHMYAFQQTRKKQSLPISVEDFHRRFGAYLGRYIKQNSDCTDLVELHQSRIFLGAVVAGKFDMAYTHILYTYPDCRHVGHITPIRWLGVLAACFANDPGKIILTQQEQVHLRELLIANYNGQKSVLDIVTRHLTPEHANIDSGRGDAAPLYPAILESDHVGPVILPYWISHSFRMVVAKRAVEEAKLTDFLSSYLLDESSFLRKDRFTILMSYARCFYVRTDRCYMDNGQLIRLNFDYLFYLLASIPNLSSQIREVEVDQIKSVDRLGRPLKTYIGTLLSMGEGLPSIRFFSELDCLATLNGFENWLHQQVMLIHDQFPTLESVPEVAIRSPRANMMLQMALILSQTKVTGILRLRTREQIQGVLTNIRVFIERNLLFSFAFRSSIADAFRPLHRDDLKATSLGALSGGGAVGIIGAVASFFLGATTGPVGICIAAAVFASGGAVLGGGTGLAVKRYQQGDVIRLLWQLMDYVNNAISDGDIRRQRVAEQVRLTQGVLLEMQPLLGEEGMRQRRQGR
jgi:hypothetical protein